MRDVHPWSPASTRWRCACRAALPPPAQSRHSVVRSRRPAPNSSERVSATAEAVVADLGERIPAGRRRRRDAGRAGIDDQGCRPSYRAAASGRRRGGRDRGRGRNCAGTRAERHRRPACCPHYAPGAAVRIDAASVSGGEALLAFGPRRVAGAERARAVSTCRRRATCARRRLEPLFPSPCARPHRCGHDRRGACAAFGPWRGDQRPAQQRARRHRATRPPCRNRRDRHLMTSAPGIDKALLDRFTAIVGPGHALTAPAVSSPSSPSAAGSGAGGPRSCCGRGSVEESTASSHSPARRAPRSCPGRQHGAGRRQNPRPGGPRDRAVAVANSIASARSTRSPTR